jgi:uncharacterized small protein (DUF1192 family)
MPSYGPAAASSMYTNQAFDKALGAVITFYNGLVLERDRQIAELQAEVARLTEEHQKRTWWQEPARNTPTLPTAPPPPPITFDAEG